ncbi:MAG: acetate kinase [Clostridia bacterium]|jgi:acetate kinase|nr:acetate kinase [Clostridia bacterium]
MKILVLNAGSSSLKYQFFDMDTRAVIAKGQCERIGIDKPFLKYKANNKELIKEFDIPNHKVAVDLVLKMLVDSEYGVIRTMDEIGAIGHRVVHGGEKFSSSVVVTEEILKELEEYIELAPLHMPANITGIKACIAVMPTKPNVAVFDTAFHSSMPKRAFMYGLPYWAYSEYKIRRYGFHGTSHKYVSGEMIKLLDKPIEETKIVTCHLGNGSSICAVKGGKSIDTSMGFTPLAGVIMGTRSGDIDAASVEFLAKKMKLSIAEIISILNNKSGLLGISEISSDMRELENAFENKNERAILAIDMLSYQIKKYIGSYSAAMGGIDAIVFTGGIGEYTPSVREKVMSGLEYLGVKLSDKANYNAPRGVIFQISAVDSDVKVYIIPTNEELVIASDTMLLTK